MKSKSPFQAKIDIFQGSTSTYRHPSTVIQPIVGAQVGAQIAKTASEVTVKAITAKSEKPKSEKPKKEFDFKVTPPPGEITVPDYKGDLRALGGKETREVPGKKSIMKLSEMTPEQKSWRKQKRKELGPKGYAELVNKNKPKNITQSRTYSLDEEGEKTDFSDWTNSPNTMKGSPVKHNDQQEVSDLQQFQNTMKLPGSFATNAFR